MTNVITFPKRAAATRGIIYAWRREDGWFEIGQESESGNSWGSFETFRTAEAAIAGAYRLNREQYKGICAIDISPDVLGDGGAVA